MLGIFSVIGRYIIRKHIAPFLFGTFLVVFLFLMQYLINYLDKLVGKGLSAWIIIQLITYHLGWMVVLAIPMGVLFSTLMAFGGLSSNSEITVIKASGGSLISLMRPIIFFGVLLTIFVFWFNDAILPETNHQAKVLYSDITRKKPTFALEPGQFSNQITGYTILSRFLDSSSGKMTGVTIYDNSKLGQQNVISADSGYIRPNVNFDKMILTLYNGEIHQSFNLRPEIYRIIKFKDAQIRIETEDFAFKRSSGEMLSRGDRELHISDMEKILAGLDSNMTERQVDLDKLLKQHLELILYGKNNYNTYYQSQIIKNDSLLNLHLNALKNAQMHIEYFRNSVQANINMIESIRKRQNQYIVEIQKKYAIPFACLIFVLIGAPLGIVIRRGNFGLSAILSLAFYIFYWVFLIGGEKLADRDFISPTLSMWSANIIIGIVGIILTIRVNRESFKYPVLDLLRKLKILKT
ncbi:MAG: LptF/LptG family permease [Candidatus Kapaibacteriota bacterium]